MDDICDADTVLAFVGIGYSDDKLLQTRIFSYADTQRHRLGPNYLLLPVNAPKCPHHNNHHDGFMNFMHRDEEVSLHRLPCSGIASPDQPLCHVCLSSDSHCWQLFVKQQIAGMEPQKRSGALLSSGMLCDAHVSVVLSTVSFHECVWAASMDRCGH